MVSFGAGRRLRGIGMDVTLANLHNHTNFSSGAWDIDDICKAHLKLRGVRVHAVGISDHLFCTPTTRPITNASEFERMFTAETKRYVADVHAARARWAGQLHLYCGCEIHWPHNRDMLDAIPNLLTGIDYVLFERLDWAGMTQLANIARRWPVPIGIAQTDVAEQFGNTPAEQVVRTLANARIFYEMNAAFWPLAEDHPWFALLPQHRVRVCLGTDTQDDLRCIERLPEMHAYAIRRGLGDRFFLPAAPVTAAG